MHLSESKPTKSAVYMELTENCSINLSLGNSCEALELDQKLTSPGNPTQQNELFSPSAGEDIRGHFLGEPPIGFGDNTDLLWWNNVNNQFCQLTSRVS